MAQKDLNGIGEQLSRELKKAMDSMDFSKLNQTVSDTVNQALKEARGSIEKAAENGNGKGNRGPVPTSYQKGVKVEQEGHRTAWEAAKDAARGEKNVTRRQDYVRSDVLRNGTGSAAGVRRAGMSTAAEGAARVPAVKKQFLKIRPKGQVAGVLCTVLGSIGLTVALVVTVVSLVFGSRSALAMSAIQIFLVLAAGFGGLLGTGIHFNRRNGRLSLYSRLSRGKEYIALSELAEKTGKTKAFLVKDIKKMLTGGMMPGSRMDHENTCLIFTEEAYQHYLDSRQAYALRQEEEKRLLEQKKKEEESLESSAELKEMIEHGNTFLAKIREANDRIPGEEISGKIDRLEDIVRQIFKAVRENPDEIDEMDKFMEYYLPTTVKLLDSYQKFDEIASPGENVLSAKREIEKTLDTIESAFVRLLDDLYQNAAFDAETDAAVLKTMLEQEGLVNSQKTMDFGAELWADKQPEE